MAFALTYGSDVYWEGYARTCGWMEGPVAGTVGASCTASRGYGGQGRMYSSSSNSSEQLRWQLSNLGWEYGAGGILVITSDYRVLDENGDETDQPPGRIYGLGWASAYDTSECLTDFADWFGLMGAAVAYQPSE